MFSRLGKVSVTIAAAMSVFLEITGASEDLTAHAEHDGIDVETPV